jgi:hypothetical protein
MILLKITPWMEKHGFLSGRGVRCPLARSLAQRAGHTGERQILQVIGSRCHDGMGR